MRMALSPSTPSAATGLALVSRRLGDEKGCPKAASSRPLSARI
jgi:hypothetical protein